MESSLWLPVSVGCAIYKPANSALGAIKSQQPGQQNCNKYRNTSTHQLNRTQGPLFQFIIMKILRNKNKISL